MTAIISIGLFVAAPALVGGVIGVVARARARARRQNVRVGSRYPRHFWAAIGVTP
jgi:hypothetical protein